MSKIPADGEIEYSSAFFPCPQPSLVMDLPSTNVHREDANR